MKFHSPVYLILAAALSLPIAAQHNSPNWVETFQESPAAYPAFPAGASTSATPPVTGTLRYRFGISVGGSQVIVKLSNELGDTPLNIAGASIAIAGDQMNAAPGTVRRLTFNGNDSVVIPAGAPIFSDPVQLDLPGVSDMIGAVYLKDSIALQPGGGSGMTLTEGDTVMTEAPAEARKLYGRPIMTALLVLPKQPAHVVVAIGDSITDPSRNVPTEKHGWVATVAERMAAGGKKTRNMAIVSAGISGNQVLNTLMGTNALGRFDRDVLSVPGLSYIILFEGINDIGITGKNPIRNTPQTSAEDLIAGYKQMAMRAHARGVKIYICTLTQFEGSFYYSPEKALIRDAVNQWIRTQKEFDGVIDFDAVTRDPAHPAQMKAELNSGDHLHPNAAGYQAMGEAVDIALFK